MNQGASNAKEEAGVLAAAGAGALGGSLSTWEAESC